VAGWPLIGEPELVQRLAMDDQEFVAYMQGLIAQVPPRTYEAALYERAVGYPWMRPAGSYRLAGAGVELIEGLPAGEQNRTMDRFTASDSGRVPIVSIGSNAAPSVLEQKFAHFPDEDDRAVLALTGRLHDFDVGVAPQPAIYGAMPATLFPSPGTAVCATVLWVTPAQFTQLTWSELSYRLGKLRTRFEVDDSEISFDEVLVFVSRFGTFCIDGRPVALAAIPATARTAVPLSQEQLLDAAAALAIGPEANAEMLVRGIFEDLDQTVVKLAAVRKESLPFASEHWIPYSQANEA
jgi:hypothetical protein